MNLKKIQALPIEEVHHRLQSHGYAADEIKVLFTTEQAARDFYVSLHETAKLQNSCEPDDPTSKDQLSATEQAEAKAMLKSVAERKERREAARAELRKKVVAAESKLNEKEAEKAQAHLPVADRVSPAEVKSAMSDIHKLLSRDYDE